MKKMFIFKKIFFIFLIFFFTFGWVFSGWPRIWQNPIIPPEILKTQATSGDVILLWDTANGSIPSGWTCISCTSGDAFYGVFPRAASSYGISTAGADTHTHALTYSSATQGASGTAKGTNASNKALLDTHAHTWGDIAASGNGSTLPPYKNLNFIYANNPSVLPANVIAIFDDTLPSGWTRYAALDGNYLRGYSDNTTGGAATHMHTISAGAVTSGNASKLLSDSGSGGTAGTDLAHSLPASDTNFTNANNAPPYLEVIFAYNSSGGDTSIPTGLIAFFDAAPPSGWTTVSDSAPWTNSFLKGAATYGGTGGSSADHNHGGSIDLISDNSSSQLTNLGATGSYTGASGTHNHTITYTIDLKGSLPVYRDVILAKRIFTPSVSVTLDQSSFDYGFVPDNTAANTLSLWGGAGITATNDGNVTEDFDIYGANTANWTLAGTAGSNQYVHKFCNDTDNNCVSPPTNYTALTTSPQTFKTGVIASGTAVFQLEITTPNPSSVYTQQSAVVTIQASQQ